MGCAVKKFCALLLAFGASMSAGLAAAQGFSALVSPPRIEMTIKPGQDARQVIEITQVGDAPGRFRIYTNDWQLNDQGAVQFFDELQPGSCRPWVALERRELTIAGNAKMRFRIQVSPPADGPLRECRFAVMIEGLDTGRVSPGALSFPVSGRIGVIVYAAMDGTKPRLSIVGQSVSMSNEPKDRLPTLIVKNEGNAHGRLAGFLTGVDALGQKMDLSPNTLPILPGETRPVTLLINPDPNLPKAATPQTITYPIKITGNLEWSGKAQAFEATFSPAQ
jgi:hypothetical protein